MDQVNDLYRIRREADLVIDVAYFLDRIPNDLIDIDSIKRGFGGDFSCNGTVIGGHQRFTSDPTHGVVLQAEVENCITNLISHLIRVAHTD